MLTVAIIIILATAFGLWRRAVDGKVKDVSAPATTQASEPAPEPSQAAGVIGGQAERPGPAVAQLEHVDHAGEPGYLGAEDIGEELGQRATMVQFSSAFCQPCRATRQILSEVAEIVPDIRHVEIDAEAHLDLVRRLHIMRTPTVLLVDGEGLIRKRASGQPRKVDVLAALGEFVTPADDPSSNPNAGQDADSVSGRSQGSR